MIKKIMILLKRLIPKVAGMYLVNIIFSLVMCMFLSLGIIFFLNGYYVLRSPIIFIISVSALYHIVLFIIKENKSNMVMYFIITLLISILLFGGLIFNIPYREFLYNTYQWCRKYNGENDLFHRNYSLFTTFILILVINTSIYLLHKIRFTKYILSLLLPAGLILCTVYGISISKVTIICIFLYVLPVLVRVMGKSHKSFQKEYSDSAITIYLIPVYCIMIVIATIIPSSKEPIKWHIIKEIALDISEKGEYIRHKLEYFTDKTGKEFVFSSAGYEDKEDNELGGLLENEKSVSLIVSTSSKSRSKGYLIGSIYDVYTGRGFKKSDRKVKLEERDYYYDFIELLNTFAKEDEKGTDLANIIVKGSYDITYKIRTRTIFHPSRMIEINLPRKTKYEESTIGNMVLNKAEGMGYSYDLSYYELNLESEVLKEIFRNAEKVDEIASLEGINKVLEEYLYLKDYANNMDIYHLYEGVTDRREIIYESYTKLPSTVTDRTKKLAQELTKDYYNDYDKLKAIEAFLNNYEYTTKVSKVKGNVDFVDNFLFEERKGYCTYYAASMFVLARCANIPVRYIEGYIVDYNEFEKDFTYKVLSSNAHAWVEGYIKGIGWIPFEPTAGFYQSRYSAWVDYSKVNNSGLNGQLYSKDYNTLHDSNQLVENIKNTVIVEQASRMEYINTIIKVFLLLFIIIILTIIFILSYYYFLDKRYKKKYLSSDNGKKVIILVNHLLRLFTLDGYKLLESETLLQFCNSRGRSLEKSNSFLDVVNVYMKVRYGEEFINSEELELVATFYQEYKESLIPKVGKLKLIYFRFFYLISMND